MGEVPARGHGRGVQLALLATTAAYTRWAHAQLPFALRSRGRAAEPLSAAAFDVCSLCYGTWVMSLQRAAIDTQLGM